MSLDYTKRLIAVRYRLRGRADLDKAWFLACDALEFALPHHQGLRADERTREFDHMLQVTQKVMTLPGVRHPVATVATALLHDTIEDVPELSLNDLRAHLLSNPHVARHHADEVDMIVGGIESVSKVIGGRKKPKEAYAAGLIHPVGSLVKGADRDHNLSTLITPRPDGSPARPSHKQIEQADETEELILPVLKTARARFIDQEPAYENLKNSIGHKLFYIRALNGQVPGLVLPNVAPVGGPGEPEEPAAPGLGRR